MLKLVQKSKENFGKLAIGTGALVVGNSAMAAGPDFTSLTGSVDFATVITAVLAITLAVAGVKVAIIGARKVLSMIK